MKIIFFYSIYSFAPPSFLFTHDKIVSLETEKERERKKERKMRELRKGEREREMCVHVEAVAVVLSWSATEHFFFETL